MEWIYDDGGRSAAGYKGTAGDCGCRAVAIATGMPYQEVYNALNEIGRGERASHGKRSNARTGVWPKTITKLIEPLGWAWTPTMGIGTGCRVHLDAGELPDGRLIVRLSKHFTAVIDGVIHDTYDPQGVSARCVYGYWKQAAP